MPEQFVNPSPKLKVEGFLFFDFPCEYVGEGVAKAPQAINSGSYSAVGCFGNVNLEAPVGERLYGPLGNPPKEQGHPFMKEYDPRGIIGREAEDPVGHDQIVDIDRGIQIDHTGRLSGSFVEAIASKPYFSQVVVSAVSVAPVGPHTASIQLDTIRTWLEPQPEGPNAWFWRHGTTTHELLFSAHLRIDAPRRLRLMSESVYKLVYQWKFYKYIGSVPYPDNAPDPRRNSERLGISGFDEAMAFEVIGQTEDLP